MWHGSPFTIRALLYSFSFLSTRWGWVINAMTQLFYPQERYVVPIVQEAVWELRPVWMGAENFSPHWDSIPELSSP